MTFRWIPNAICVVRLLLVVPVVMMLLAERYIEALALIVIAGLSDGLDGYLAKTFNWQTRLGGLLDPAADKLLLVSVFAALTYLGIVPLAVTAIVIGRDVVIVIGAVTYQLLIAPVEGEPTAISKLNTAFQLAFVLFAITNAAFAWPPNISVLVLGGAVVFTSVVSGLNYVLRWGKRAWQTTHQPA